MEHIVFVHDLFLDFDGYKPESPDSGSLGL